MKEISVAEWGYSASLSQKLLVDQLFYHSIAFIFLLWLTPISSCSSDSLSLGMCFKDGHILLFEISLLKNVYYSCALESFRGTVLDGLLGDV